MCSDSFALRRKIKSSEFVFGRHPQMNSKAGVLVRLVVALGGTFRKLGASVVANTSFSCQAKSETLGFEQVLYM